MKQIFAILFVIIYIQGCVSAPKAPFVPPTGAIFTDVKAPLTTEFDNQKITKTYGEVSSTHIAYYIFNFAIGDTSIKNAMKEGWLNDASYVDYEWMSVLGIFGRLTINVYGNLKPEE